MSYMGKDVPEWIAHTILVVSILLILNNLIFPLISYFRKKPVYLYRVKSIQYGYHQKEIAIQFVTNEGVPIKMALTHQQVEAMLPQLKKQLNLSQNRSHNDLLS